MKIPMAKTEAPRTTASVLVCVRKKETVMKEGELKGASLCDCD